MNGEIIITKEEMMVFLNQQPPDINIDYPLTNEQIMSLESEGKNYLIDLHIDDSKDFSDSELWDQEKPSYNDYLQCFLSSNLITYKNLKDLHQTYRSYLPVSSDVVYAPDTNLFYNQFISSGNIPPNELLFVDSVHKEINRVLNKKYNPTQINEMKRVVRYQKNILDEFINRRMKASRKAYNLALQEYLHYSDRSYKVVKTPDLVQDKEENDAIFVKAVSEYRKESGAYPVVLTCDRLLTDLCESHKVPFFCLELPHQIHPETCSPKQLSDLICNLAGVLGVIQVNKTLVFGEYRGKRKVDEYKLKYLSGETPHSIERDLEICRELMKLGIKF